MDSAALSSTSMVHGSLHGCVTIQYYNITGGYSKGGCMERCI